MKKIKNLVNNHLTVFIFAAVALGILCVVAACYIILSNLGFISGFFNYVTRVLSPIIIGLVLAYIIDPIAKFFEAKIFRKLRKEKIRRTLSVIIALVIVFSFFAVFIGTLIPSLISSISMLIDNADTYYENVENAVERVNSLGFGISIDLSSMVEAVKSSLTDITKNLSDNFSLVLDTTINIGNTLFNIIIGVILAIYFLFCKEFLLTGLNRLRAALHTPKKLKSLNQFWSRCHNIFTQYIDCNLIDALLIGVVNAVFMVITGMPYVPLVSFSVALANLIPSFGPIIGAGIGAFVLVLVKPSYAVLFLIFTALIPSLDAYVIKPKLFSNSFGIPAVWTLIAITIGGKMFGFLGILLAIPVAAIIAFVYEENILPWLQRKNKERTDRAEKKNAALSETVIEPKE